MTLTTERLKWIHDAATELSATKLKMTMRPDELLVLTSELLANREAQPVALVDRRPAASGSICWQNGGKDLPHGTELFTAPPAPAVVKLPTEFYSGEGIVVRLEEVMAALAVVGVQYERKANAKTRCEFPAPAVPEEMTVEQAYENVQTWHYANGWNACRAAMLAQPVSSGYTFNSPVIPDGWKLVPIDATRAMIDAAQRVEEDGYDAMHKEMLAAVPEGGK